MEGINDQQAEIACLRRKIRQIEKGLEAKDDATQGHRENEDARNNRAEGEDKGNDNEDVSTKEGDKVDNPEMADFMKERRKEEQEWKERFARLDQC